MSNDRELRTRFSMAALDLATLFKTQLGAMTFGNVKFRPELDAPDAVSTSGGRLAIQHIRLVPSSQGFTPIIAGTVNGPQNVVDLRIFDYVDAAHRQRFSKPAPLDRASYEQFIAAAKQFFGAMQMRTNLQSPPAELRERPQTIPPPTGSSSSVLWIIGAAVVVVAAVVAILLLRHR